MTNKARWKTWAIGSFTLGLVACGSRVREGGDSNSNWLKSCDLSAECGSTLECLCGICTKECATEQACESRGGATCGIPDGCDVSVGICSPAGEAVAPPPTTTSGPVPEPKSWQNSSVRDLPEGEPVEELAVQWPKGFVVDREGVMWVGSCQGVHAVAADGIRYYRPRENELPHYPSRLAVDDQNRKWAAGKSKLTVLDGPAWRTVYNGNMDNTSIASDGGVWAIIPDGLVQIALDGTTRAVAPPEGTITAIAAESRDRLWLSTSDGLYHYADGAWSGPVTAAREITWSSAAGWAMTVTAEALVRVRPSDAGLESEVLSNVPLGSPIGYSVDGLWVFQLWDTFGWYRDWNEPDRQATGVSSTVAAAVLAQDGTLWQLQAENNAIAPLGAGDAEPVPLVPFDRASMFPWRAQPFADAVADEAIDIGKDELVSFPKNLVGKKVHLVGALGGGFETQCIRLGQENVSFHSESAPQLSVFWLDHDEIEVGSALSCDDGSLSDVQLWDLYGYLETGDCFWSQQIYDGGADRQFWLVEAYPVGISEEERANLKADLAAR